MTLVELLVSMGISGIVLTAVGALSVQSAKSLAAVSNYAELDQQSRMALDTMSLKIRSCNRLVYYNSQWLQFSHQGTSLYYIYSGDRLYQYYQGRFTVILEDCKNLRFTVYQRNVKSNSFTQYVASGPADAKSIMLNWTCKKSVIGVAQTESIQSARIVMRNNP